MHSRSPRRTAAFVILIGIIGLIPLMRKTRFQAYHTVNVWQLLASGACFCAGLVPLGKRKPSAEGWFGAGARQDSPGNRESSRPRDL